jgi:hypothetical protein
MEAAEGGEINVVRRRIGRDLVKQSAKDNSRKNSRKEQ